MKKSLTLILSTILICNTITITSYASTKPNNPNNLLIYPQSKKRNEKESFISKNYDTKVNMNAKVIFIDKNFKKELNYLPRGIEREEYDYSYYKLDSYRIIEYNVGPIENTTHLISVSTGPTDPYMTTRDYYGAINYDKYAFVVKRYDVYKLYNGFSWVDNKEYYMGTENVDEVKRPHEIIYYRDSRN